MHRYMHYSLVILGPPCVKHHEIESSTREAGTVSQAGKMKAAKRNQGLGIIFVIPNSPGEPANPHMVI